jgi:tetratricopeptide (TPR) repeat protein
MAQPGNGMAQTISEGTEHFAARKPPTSGKSVGVHASSPATRVRTAWRSWLRLWVLGAAILTAALSAGCAAVATNMIVSAVTNVDVWASILAPRGAGSPYREAGPFYQKQDWQGLADLGKKRLEENSLSADWMVLRGHALLNLKDFEPASRLFKRAQEINPEDVNALNGFAAAKRGMGKPADLAEALVAAERAVVIDTTHAGSQALLAELLLERNRPADVRRAAQSYSEVVRLANESPIGWYGVGRIAKREGDLDLTARCIEALEKIDPEYAKLLKL